MSNTAPAEVTSSAPMPPVTTGRTEQVNIRLPHEHVERSQAIRDALAQRQPGLSPPTTSEVYRAIMAKGLEAWEEELGIVTSTKPEPASKKKTTRGR